MPALGPSDAIAARARAVAAVAGPAYAYANAVDPRSPWPEMRRSANNSGRSPITARYHGDHPWSFRTRRGIFSTPVIGRDGTVYFGSADGNFYAVKRDGHERWRFH